MQCLPLLLEPVGRVLPDISASLSSFISSHKDSPSTESIAGAPSLVASRRAFGVNVPSRDNQTLVCTPHHRATEVRDNRSTDRALPALTLKYHVEGQEVDPKHTGAVLYISKHDWTPTTLSHSRVPVGRRPTRAGAWENRRPGRWD